MTRGSRPPVPAATGVRPLVIAHRGDSRHCPENTLAAFDAALAQGADGIELDLQLSHDRIPVVYHDRTLAKAGLPQARVGELDLAHLKRLRPGARLSREYRGERIPTLQEVLDRYAGRTRLYVEIKARDGDLAAEGNRDLMTIAARRLQGSAPEGMIHLLCFDAALLDVAAAVAPRLPRVLNLKPSLTLGRRLRERLADLAYLSCDVRTLTPRFGRAVRGAGGALLVYTCNTAAAVNRALAAGAHGVMADDPAWLRARLERAEIVP
jgi:glycerophosphoryl diester phosphodiesterase